MKHQRRFREFCDKIISMYARCMTARELRGHLEDLYGHCHEGTHGKILWQTQIPRCSFGFQKGLKSSILGQ
jgi:mutator family transposase